MLFEVGTYTQAKMADDGGGDLSPQESMLQRHKKEKKDVQCRYNKTLYIQDYFGTV